MSKKHSKNLQKVQDMLDGKGTGKIQVGQYSPTDEVRKVGDKWTDSDGNEWEQKEGYRTKNTREGQHHSWDIKCSDCDSLIIKPWDKEIYKFNGRCYYCQIDFEAELKGNAAKYKEWKESQQNRIKEDYVKKWEEDNAEFVKELENMENPFDMKVANALANGNVEMTINKNTK